MVAFTIFESLVIEHRKDFADFSVKTRSKSICEMKCKDIQKNISKKHIGLVKTGNFLLFDLIFG